MPQQNSSNRFPKNIYEIESLNYFLLLRPITPIKNAVRVLLTGTTAETTLFSDYNLYPHDMSDNSVIEIELHTSHNNTQNNKTIRIYWGNLLIATSIVSASKSLRVDKTVHFRNSRTSQVIFNGSIAKVVGESANEPLSGSLDTTQQHEFKVTGQLANANDIIAFESVFVRVTY